MIKNDHKEDKVYLLKTDLLSESNQVVYKIGRSSQIGLKRFSNYPDTYRLCLVRMCIDSKLQLHFIDSNKFMRHCISFFQKYHEIPWKISDTQKCRFVKSWRAELLGRIGSVQTESAIYLLPFLVHRCY